MKYLKWLTRLFFVIVVLISCSEKKKNKVSAANTTIDETASLDIKDILTFAMQHKGKLSDSVQLYYPGLLDGFYAGEDYETVWSRKNNFTPLADSLYSTIAQSMQMGLFPEDYHYSQIRKLKAQISTGAKVNSSTIIAQTDLLFTDAFIRMAEHLKKGRLDKDSLTLTADTSLQENYFTGVLKEALENKNIKTALQALEPKHKEYIALRNAIPSFLQTMDQNRYTYIVYPNPDSVQMVRILAKRFYEGGIFSTPVQKPDSGTLSGAIAKYQKSKGLKVSGKISPELIKSLNASDWYKFKRIAATLDRYKTLNARWPETYVWVNLPSYQLKVMHHDSVVMTSKVIIGKPGNRTPELNSEISNIVLYPTWTVPYSIVVKEMLPIAKRNPGYFAKRGFKVLNNRGKEIDPNSVNWSKYGKNVPFVFRQNEGGGNALGIIKFNFENPYAVYLHDTNQRYLFDRTSRALSHGCVRVHLWDSMARYLIRASNAYYPNYETVTTDSISSTGDTITLSKTILRDTTFIQADSLQRYMAKKKNMALIMPRKVPIFIRYFSCVGENGKLIFFDDIYGEDKVMIDKYFAKK